MSQANNNQMTPQNSEVKSNQDTIGSSNTPMDGFFPEAELLGTAMVGTKGQFVIPLDARKRFGINPGDKLVLFGGKGGVIAVLKAEQLNKLLETII